LSIFQVCFHQTNQSTLRLFTFLFTSDQQRQKNLSYFYKVKSFGTDILFILFACLNQNHLNKSFWSLPLINYNSFLFVVCINFKSSNHNNLNEVLLAPTRTINKTLFLKWIKISQIIKTQLKKEIWVPSQDGIASRLKGEPSLSKLSQSSTSPVLAAF